MRLLMIGLGCLLVSAEATRAQDAAKLAKAAQAGRAAEEQIPDIALKAKAVLKDNCHGCHGDGGSAANGFYVLSPRSLKSRVMPGQPEQSEQSRLIRVLLPNGSMPKDGEPLAAADRQTLIDWIKAGAPRFLPKPNRTFIEPLDVFVAMVKHLKSLDEDDQPFAR